MSIKGGRELDSTDILRILLVEDDPDDVHVIRRALRTVSIAVSLTHAADGREALEILRAPGGEAAFDVVLLDLNMPVVDGWTVLRALRADRRFDRLPTCVLTTLRDPDILAEARRMGANAALSKGTTFEAACDIAQSIVDIWTGAMFVDDAA